MINLLPTDQQFRFEASKWLQTQVLLDTSEMESLIAEMEVLHICSVSRINKRGEGLIDQRSFLQVYSYYIDCLQNGRLPEEALYRHHFSSIWTASLDAVYAIEVGENRQMVRVRSPVIQLQSHHMDYSPIDGKIRSMVMGIDSILWGIQFSYPQLFLNVQTQQIEKTLDEKHLPNTALFRTLQKWLRYHTMATPLVVNTKKMNIPVRLGKQCFSWINRHPQLLQKGITIK